MNPGLKYRIVSEIDRRVKNISLYLRQRSKYCSYQANCKRMESQKINRIKVVLVENGKTGKWLAEQVGKNEATVSRWCSNKMQPSLDMLVKIAGLLNVDPRQLINGGNND